MLYHILFFAVSGILFSWTAWVSRKNGNGTDSKFISLIAAGSFLLCLLAPTVSAMRHTGIFDTVTKLQVVATPVVK